MEESWARLLATCCSTTSFRRKWYSCLNTATHRIHNPYWPKVWPAGYQCYASRMVPPLASSSQLVAFDTAALCFPTFEGLKLPWMVSIKEDSSSFFTTARFQKTVLHISVGFSVVRIALRNRVWPLQFGCKNGFARLPFQARSVTLIDSKIWMMLCFQKCSHVMLLDFAIDNVFCIFEPSTGVASFQFWGCYRWFSNRLDSKAEIKAFSGQKLP